MCSDKWHADETTCQKAFPGHARPNNHIIETRFFADGLYFGKSFLYRYFIMYFG
jgi:hypothetical protein